MASTYDPTKDLHATTTLNLGTKGKAIAPSDTVDLSPYPLAVQVTTAGDLKVLPLQNDDADTITYPAAPVGFVPPVRVRRVFLTGTTASVATVDR